MPGWSCKGILAPSLSTNTPTDVSRSSYTRIYVTGVRRWNSDLHHAPIVASKCGRSVTVNSRTSRRSNLGSKPTDCTSNASAARFSSAKSSRMSAVEDGRGSRLKVVRACRTTRSIFDVITAAVSTFTNTELRKNRLKGYSWRGGRTRDSSLSVSLVKRRRW